MGDEVSVLVVGDGPVSGALRPMVEALGWVAHVATDAEGVTEALPTADAVVVLSHHEGIDAPAIKEALAAGTPYVGAMGSRRTQTRRREWLLGNGLSEDDLGALRAPVGLDIGADTPGEIAISILAEVVAVRRGSDVAVGSISERDGAIHPDAAPGTATCPGG
ncbi:XdhC family protein [Nocardioides donggukensis]|uniref:XdhC family protein n=1 Tax=Nocardioides donggukensis TaxID=2774019 RepID=A0A927Q1C3_9ACTN|nr:XdhC family protein [Nocardioides donggukensis]MBD8868606.1 XdhC family protein [Nocardioides donggukensis]